MKWIGRRFIRGVIEEIIRMLKRYVHKPESHDNPVVHKKKNEDPTKVMRRY